MATSLIRMDLTGDKELIRSFRRLPKTIERRIVKPSVRKGARPLRSQMRKNLKARLQKQTTHQVSETTGKTRRRTIAKGTGNLLRSITMREKVYTGAFAVIVGPSWLIGRHGHLFEFGTKERFTRRGLSRGIMPAGPFSAEAFARQGEASARKIARAIRDGVLREAAKEGERSGRS